MPVATLTAGISIAPAPAVVAVIYHGEGGAARIEMTGSQTYVVDLAMMPPTVGLKGLRVEFDLRDASGSIVTTPITITWTSNSVSKSEELSPGGWFALASPTPTHGVTALSIVSTAAAVVHVYAVG